MPLRLTLILTVAASLVLPAAAARTTRRPAKPKVPPTAAYTITTSAQDVESLQVEARLVQFIRALQRGQRAKAASLLSSRVSQKARQDLLTKRWLPARVGVKGEFTQLFFWRDLHIRTQRIHGETRQLVVSPRRIPFVVGKKPKQPTGVLEVPMVKERGQWWVDLRP